MPTSVPSADPRPGARDLVVCGGGIVGLAVAWRAARAGLSVTVLDPSPGDGATRAAAGMLAAVSESDFGEEHLARLNLASAARWPTFAAELSSASGDGSSDGSGSDGPRLRDAGTLAVAYDADDLALLRRLLDLHRAWGLDSAEVSVAEARRREPYLGQRLAGAAWTAGDHAVDPRATHAALARAIRARAGAGIVRRAAVRLERDARGRVVAVHDNAGVRHAASAVLIATGASTGALLADVPEVRVPVRPVKGITLRLDADPSFAPEHVVRGTVQGRPVYVVPRGPGTGTGPGTGPQHREIVVGATSDERPDDRRADAGGVFALLRDARALLPGLDEAALVEATPRARPATPDNLPLIGETGVPGLLAAVGHGRNGVLLAPLTADAVVAALTGGAPPDDALTAADPRRFSPALTAPVQPVPEGSRR